MEPLTGLDAAFLALETETTRAHVAGVLVLDPPATGAAGSGDPVQARADGASGARNFAAIRSVVEQRLDRVPRLRQRVRRAPLDLWRPVWIDDPDLDLDLHVRRAVLPAPGGRRELDALVGEVMSRPLDADRPLWEMVVAEGLTGGRIAVIARLHHAILDGEAGAMAMAAFLDAAAGEGATSATSPPPPVPSPPPAPSPAPSMWRHGASALARQAPEIMEALRRGVGTLGVLVAHHRRLVSEGKDPPPVPFQAPRTSLNGNVGGERRFTSLRVPLEDLELVRRGSGDAGAGRPTVNDVILCAVGGALMRYFEARGESPSSSLVALVPVSTRRREVAAPGVPVTLGNDVSGMLVPLSTTVADPVARLAAVSRATAAAKGMEARAGGDSLETVLRAVPPAVLSALMRGAGALQLFDRVPPPFNVAVSSVVVPDLPLWWAGRPLVDVLPAGPVADGFGLNVTAMTYRGSVHFGLLAAPRLVPDVEELATLLDDSLAELVLAALGTASSPGGARHRPGFTRRGGPR